MKELNAINERIDGTDEIIESLVKKNTEMEKQLAKIAQINILDYSAALDKIIQELEEIKMTNRDVGELDLLTSINAKLDKLPKSAHKQFRLLLFPETNQGQYYKIVFGRLIPWGLAFMVATYIFITGYKAIGIYRYNQEISQSVHYQRAWLYLQLHAKKKVLNAMDDAYNKTKDR